MAQLSALGAAVALGAAGGLVYDLLRVLRRRRPGLTHAADGLFALLCLLGTLGVLTQVGGGEPQLYMLLGAGATALAAEPEGAGYVISIANSSTTNSLTVDLLTWEGMKNGRLELTYPEELTLVSARSTLDAENGITDLDASKPGTVHFAWAAYSK